jgi:hypothetical protein
VGATPVGGAQNGAPRVDGAPQPLPGLPAARPPAPSATAGSPDASAVALTQVPANAFAPKPLAPAKISLAPEIGTMALAGAADLLAGMQEGWLTITLGEGARLGDAVVPPGQTLVLRVEVKDGGRLQAATGAKGQLDAAGTMIDGLYLQRGRLYPEVPWLPSFLEPDKTQEILGVSEVRDVKGLVAALRTQVATVHHTTAKNRPATIDGAPAMSLGKITVAFSGKFNGAVGFGGDARMVLNEGASITGWLDLDTVTKDFVLNAMVENWSLEVPRARIVDNPSFDLSLRAKLTGSGTITARGAGDDFHVALEPRRFGPDEIVDAPDTWALTIDGIEGHVGKNSPSSPFWAKFRGGTGALRAQTIVFDGSKPAKIRASGSVVVPLEEAVVRRPDGQNGSVERGTMLSITVDPASWSGDGLPEVHAQLEARLRGKAEVTPSWLPGINNAKMLIESGELDQGALVKLTAHLSHTGTLTGDAEVLLAGTQARMTLTEGNAPALPPVEKPREDLRPVAPPVLRQARPLKPQMIAASTPVPEPIMPLPEARAADLASMFDASVLRLQMNSGAITPVPSREDLGRAKRVGSIKVPLLGDVTWSKKAGTVSLFHVVKDGRVAVDVTRLSFHPPVLVDLPGGTVTVHSFTLREDPTSRPQRELGNSFTNEIQGLPDTVPDKDAVPQRGYLHADIIGTTGLGMLGASDYVLRELVGKRLAMQLFDSETLPLDAQKFVEQITGELAFVADGKMAARVASPMLAAQRLSSIAGRAVVVSKVDGNVKTIFGTSADGAGLRVASITYDPPVMVAIGGRAIAIHDFDLRAARDPSTALLVPTRISVADVVPADAERVLADLESLPLTRTLFGVDKVPSGISAFKRLVTTGSMAKGETDAAASIAGLDFKSAAMNGRVTLKGGALPLGKGGELRLKAGATFTVRGEWGKSVVLEGEIDLESASFNMAGATIRLDAGKTRVRVELVDGTLKSIDLGGLDTDFSVIRAPSRDDLGRPTKLHGRIRGALSYRDGEWTGDLTNVRLKANNLPGTVGGDLEISGSGPLKFTKSSRLVLGDENGGRLALRGAFTVADGSHYELTRGKLKRVEIDFGDKPVTVARLATDFSAVIRLPSPQPSGSPSVVDIPGMRLEDVTLRLDQNGIATQGDAIATKFNDTLITNVVIPGATGSAFEIDRVALHPAHPGQEARLSLDTRTGGHFRLDPVGDVPIRGIGLTKSFSFGVKGLDTNVVLAPGAVLEVGFLHFALGGGRPPSFRMIDSVVNGMLTGSADPGVRLHLSQGLVRADIHHLASGDIAGGAGALQIDTTYRVQGAVELGAKPASEVVLFDRCRVDSASLAGTIDFVGHSRYDNTRTGHVRDEDRLAAANLVMFKEAEGRVQFECKVGAGETTELMGEIIKNARPLLTPGERQSTPSAE